MYIHMYIYIHIYILYGICMLLPGEALPGTQTSAITDSFLVIKVSSYPSMQPTYLHAKTSLTFYTHCTGIVKARLQI